MTKADASRFSGQKHLLTRRIEGRSRWLLLASAVGAIPACDTQYNKPAVCEYHSGGVEIRECAGPPNVNFLRLDAMRARDEMVAFEGVEFFAGPDPSRFPFIFSPPLGFRMSVIARIRNTNWYLAEVDLSGQVLEPDVAAYLGRHYRSLGTAQLYVYSDCDHKICIAEVRAGN